MQRLSDFARYELIGRVVCIKDALNEKLIGLMGKIIDETKNLLIIKTKSGIKKIPKKSVSIIVEFGKKKVKISGGLLVNKPEDRIKKLRK